MYEHEYIYIPYGQRSFLLTVVHPTYSGWPKKVRIITYFVLKPAIKARFFINFDYKMSTKI